MNYIGKKKKYISVYLRNHEEGPSCYYRVAQFLDEIKGYEFKYNDALKLRYFRINMDFKGGISKKLFQFLLYILILLNRIKQIYYDIKFKPEIIIVQREIFPRYLPQILIKAYLKLVKNTKVIWDFDDSILECGEISKAEWNILSEYSYRIIATSDYLLNKVKASKKLKVIMPTTDGFCKKIDLNNFSKIRKNEYESVIRLVWVGTHTNLKNIVNIIGQIADAGKKLKKLGKSLELVVVCNIDHPIFHEQNDSIKVYYIKWTRSEAEKAILQSHIGLMPLPDTESSKGKGGFKLIQYISTGIPVIASNIGLNKTIVTNDIGILINNDDEWSKAILEFSIDINKWDKYCSNSIKRYNEKYSYRSNLNTWNSILRELFYER